MKSLTLTLALFSTVACSDNVASSPSPLKPMEEKREIAPILTCDENLPAHACVEKACEVAGAKFDQASGICECAPGEIFYAGAGGMCKSPFNIIDDGALTYQYIYKKNSNFYIQSMTEDLSKAELDQLVRTISIPVYPGKIIFNFYAYKSEVVGPALRDSFNLSGPLTELVGNNINAGVSSAQLNESRQSLFVPNKDFNLNNFKNIGILKSILVETDLFSLEFDHTKTEIISYSEKKCAEICYEKNRIALNDLYDIERFQTFSGGNPFETGFRFYLKGSAQPFAYVVTHQNYISHFYIINNDYSINVVSNRDELIKTIPAPLKISGNDKKVVSNILPIALFESDYHVNADQVALTGPFVDQTYFGWFKANEKPFFFGKNTSLYGEEDLTSFEHSYKVAQIASNDFNNPLILMPPRALLFGDLITVQKRLNKPIIASISLAYTMSKNSCKNSSMAKAISVSSNKIFWVVGAGNSGKKENKESLEICPQSLNANNLILVAATSYNKRLLAYESSHGETYADIAVSGCEFKPNESNPTCAVAGTSYAAPRLAKILRDLALKYPHKSFGELKIALMLTAYAENNNPLPLKSGGVVEIQDAEHFLTEFSDINLESAFEESKRNPNSESQRQIYKTLFEIYKPRVFFSWKREEIVKKQIERIQKYF